MFMDALRKEQKQERVSSFHWVQLFVCGLQRLFSLSFVRKSDINVETVDCSGKKKTKVHCILRKCMEQISLWRPED